MKTFVKSVLTLLVVCFLAGSIFSAPISVSFPEDGINPARWEKLGQRQVNYGLDKDEIFVTGREGSFSAIKFFVRKSAVNFHKITVHFRDGSTQNVELRNRISAGGETRVVNLKGKRKRVIRKVTFWYDTKNTGARKAVVELWGRH